MRTALLPPTGSAVSHLMTEEEQPPAGPGEADPQFFMSEAQLDMAKAWTSEEVLHCRARWEKYLEMVQLSALWEDGPGTEQDRYRTVLDGLSAEDDRLEQQGSDISLHREKWVMIMQSRRARAVLAPHQGQLQVISDAADAVLRHEAQLLQMRAHQKEWLQATSENPGWLCNLKKVRMGDVGGADSWHVHVTTRLSNSRYYLGHNGGDYIFEHGAGRNAGCDEFGPGDNVWDPNGPAWEHPGLHTEFGLGQGDTETASFEFRGLVPRNWREYAARFEHVCKEVLQVLATIISFEPEGDGPLCGDEYRHIPAFSSISNRELCHVRNAWNTRVSPNLPYLCWARSMLDHHPRVCEFAYLVERLDGLSGGLTRLAMTPLVETVVSATNMTLEELHAAHEGILAREAARELHELRNVERCVIYDNGDGEIEEIHTFYAQPQFRVDPVHPSNRFNRPRVEAAWQVAVTLCRRDWHWADRTAAKLLAQLRGQLGLQSSADDIAKPASQSVQPQPRQLGSRRPRPHLAEEDTPTIEVKQRPRTESTSPVARGEKRDAEESQPTSESGHQEDKQQPNDTAAPPPKRRRGRPRKHPET
ncbi:uncharacterized protein MAM_03776 [Metarhizium album ARSEF 1941]|uniref:Uncharacterized protein n=1 Tax=Metarhizium album (strain ARSEF 1941) TaxID=1081103 RepID=A0A0B2WYY5_METAS|nr:uncharacterized protein MAM_03776 [Metarhizium album ARSEF 1941]KHN98652.1 hypothetical protein MAM_03776 [Metarhizium album ARSEF 1941]